MSDPDGDKIKCRWATWSREAKETSEFAAHHRDIGIDDPEIVSDFPSISLDEDTCTVTYDGNLDTYCTGDSSQV